MIHGSARTQSRSHGAVLPLRRTVRVALVDDCEVVALGLRQLLGAHPDIEVVDAGGMAERTADVLLFDPWLQRDGEPDAGPLPQGRGALVVYTWDTHRAPAEQTLGEGVRGCLSKALSGDDLAKALRRISRGHVVVAWGVDPADDEGTAAERAGLSPRETEVLGLIGRGLTNEAIAQTLFLSPNSIKSHIRSAYRKICVERRSQAVKWVHEHGLRLDTLALPGPAA